MKKHYLFLLLISLFLLGIFNFWLIYWKNKKENLKFFRRKLNVISDDASWENCTDPAILNFPKWPMTFPSTNYYYVNNFVTFIWKYFLPIVILIYLILWLERLCNLYFLPSLDCIFNDLGLDSVHNSGISGLLLSAISSAPELFISITGTFLAEDDIGVGTIVGSSVFNMLMIPAICSIYVPLLGYKLNYWSISRDAIVCAIAVSVLAFSLTDDKVMWYEAFVMILIYVLYFIALQTDIVQQTKSLLKRMNIVKSSYENCPLLADYNYVSVHSVATEDKSKATVEMNKKQNNCVAIIIFPIHLTFTVTLLSVFMKRKYHITVCLICCLFLALITYLMTWFITILGYNSRIPDSLMGLTLGAIGLGIPDALASVSVIKKGKSSMAISSALTANTFNILLGLGVPWLIKALFWPQYRFYGKNNFYIDNHYVDINSEGFYSSAIITLTILALASMIIIANHFNLDRKIGLMFFTLYLIFILLATLLELNVFYIVNLPFCEIKTFLQ